MEEEEASAAAAAGAQQAVLTPAAAGGAGGGGAAKGPSSDGHWSLLLRLGDPLRLREVKSLLAAAGVESQIVEGEVVTRGGVIVRLKGSSAAHSGGSAMKEEGKGGGEEEEEEENMDVPRSGGFDMEGPATREYAKVRALLESQYTMV